MTWQDRLAEGAYTPDDGERLVYQFEDVARSFKLRGSTFDFPDADGTLAQRTGNSSRFYPMRVFFSGADYDLESNAFEDALRAQPRGRLEHPIYGTLNVTPLGEVRRRDDLKTAANQAVIEVTFWNTIDAVYPNSQTDAASEVSAGVTRLNTAAAEQYADDISLPVADEAPFRESYENLLIVTKASLDPVATITPLVSQQFTAIYNSLIQGLPVLVQDITTLTLQTFLLVQSPGRSTAFTEAFVAYQGLVNAGINTIPAEATDLYRQDLFIASYISGLTVTALNATFETRPQAIGAASILATNFENYVGWRDGQYERLGVIDSGGAYQQLQSLVATCIGYLVELSFSLKEERRIILTRNRSVIDLCAELYKAVDDVLDFFIESNDLAWDEHLELKAGREIVYFI